MGTNAEIFRFFDDTTLQHIHVSYDGYLSGVGLVLFQRYNSPETVEALFARPGWITSLEENPALFYFQNLGPKNHGPNPGRMTVEEVTAIFEPWEPPFEIGTSGSTGRDGIETGASSNVVAEQTQTPDASTDAFLPETTDEGEYNGDGDIWGAGVYVWRNGTWYVVPSMAEWHAVLAGQGQHALTKDLMLRVCTDLSETDITPGDPALAR